MAYPRMISKAEDHENMIGRNSINGPEAKQVKKW
jgi:hypothetical protein